MIRVALNGCGRIGKNFIRAFLTDPEARAKITIVAINVGPESPEALAYSLTYDSLLGTYAGTISYTNGKLVLDGLPPITVLAQKKGEELNWHSYDIDWVIDASGVYTDVHNARKHCAAGAKAVLITAPAHGEDMTVIVGVNEHLFDPARHRIISLGSCTTNALVPMLKTAHEVGGIKQAAFTTVHAYTNSQSLLDVHAETADLRRSRAAGLNIVATTTGAMGLIDRLLPELAGRITGASLRVPVPVVSLIDLTYYAERPVTTEQLHEAFHYLAKRSPHLYACSTVPLVSCDYKGSSASVTVDLTLSYASGSIVKLFGWYDNEWGYSCRIKDFLVQRAE